MNIDEISKSKMATIESMAESIKFHFGKNNTELDKAMEELVSLIKEEKKSRDYLRDFVWAMANKM